MLALLEMLESLTDSAEVDIDTQEYVLSATAVTIQSLNHILHEKGKNHIHSRNMSYVCSMETMDAIYALKSEMEEQQYAALSLPISNTDQITSAPFHPHLIQLDEKVDINEYPMLDTDHVVNENTKLLIGDLHGNALKFLYILIRHDVLRGISQAAYEHFANQIYPTDLTEENRNQFETMLNLASVNTDALVELIGDEVADRGRNDYYFLKMLEKIIQHKVNCEILLSNHGVEFVKAYENTRRFDEVDNAPIRAKDMASMIALQQLIDNNEVNITRENMNHIIEQYYKSALKLILCDLNEENQSITFCNHAAVGLETIAEIADYFHIPYDDHPVALKAIVDKINERFQALVQCNQVHTLFSEDMEGVGLDSTKIIQNPFIRVISNRNYTQLDRPKEKHGYHFYFVNGHDMDDPELHAGHILNVDNLLGKAPNMHHYFYNIVYARKISSARNSLEEIKVEPLQTKLKFQV